MSFVQTQTLLEKVKPVLEVGSKCTKVVVCGLLSMSLTCNKHILSNIECIDQYDTHIS